MPGDGRRASPSVAICTSTSLSIYTTCENRAPGKMEQIGGSRQSRTDLKSFHANVDGSGCGFITLLRLAYVVDRRNRERRDARVEQAFVGGFPDLARCCNE